MNRAMKRRKERENNRTPTYNLNPEQLKSIVSDQIGEDIQKAKEEATRKALDFAATGMIAAFSLSLHDHFGFGVRRIRKLLEKTNKIFDALGYDGAEININDLVQLCKEEIGLDIKSEVKK